MNNLQIIEEWEMWNRPLSNNYKKRLADQPTDALCLKLEEMTAWRAFGGIVRF